MELIGQHSLFGNGDDNGNTLTTTFCAFVAGEDRQKRSSKPEQHRQADKFAMHDISNGCHPASDRDRLNTIVCANA